MSFRLFSSRSFGENQKCIIKSAFIVKRLGIILWLGILGQSKFNVQYTSPWQILFHLYFELTESKKQREGKSACGCFSASGLPSHPVTIILHAQEEKKGQGGENRIKNMAAPDINVLLPVLSSHSNNDKNKYLPYALAFPKNV